MNADREATQREGAARPKGPGIERSEHALFAWSAANAFAIDAKIVFLLPWSISHADLCTRLREASMPIAMSAIMKETCEMHL